QLEEVTKELIEILKTLQEELGDDPHFGEKMFGFVDVAFIPFYCWFHSYETLGQFIFETEWPKIIAWAKRCKQ
ncbi:hypothetical protein CICLE_v10023946mg, partial [Citrus x clementina]